MAPILLLGFGLDLVTVVATDLLFATLTKLVASGMHSRNKLVDWQITKRLWLGSLPATLAVMTFAFAGGFHYSAEWITRILGALILFSGLSLLFSSKLQLYLRAKRISAPEKFKRFQAPGTSIAGFILGTLVSMTSIGAGALGAIFLRSLYPLRMEPKKLVATDTVHAIPVSLLAGLGYLAMNQTDLELLVSLLAGSIPAVLIGTRLLTEAPPELIKRILSIALIGASFKLML